MGEERHKKRKQKKRKAEGGGSRRRVSERGDGTEKLRRLASDVWPFSALACSREKALCGQRITKQQQ